MRRITKIKSGIVSFDDGWFITTDTLKDMLNEYTERQIDKDKIIRELENCIEYFSNIPYRQEMLREAIKRIKDEPLH